MNASDKTPAPSDRSRGGEPRLIGEVVAELLAEFRLSLPDLRPAAAHSASAAA
jgi:hypothetical protein